MTTDGYMSSPEDRPSGHADSRLTALDWRRPLPLDDVQQAAAREVEALVNHLELTLDGHQRRLLHQLRLAAETLGAIRATSQIKRYSPI